MLSPLPLSSSPPLMLLYIPHVRHPSNSTPAKSSPPRRPGFVRGYCSSKETDLRRYALNRRWLDKALEVEWEARAETNDESSSAAPNVARLSENNSDRTSISNPPSTKPPRPSLKRTESETLAPPSLATAAKRPTRPIMKRTVTVTLAPPSSSSSAAPTASPPSIARMASILDVLSSPRVARARASLDSALSDSDLVEMQRQFHCMCSLVLICLLLLVRIVYVLIPQLGSRVQ
ncbi:hypothetical protein K438DRAFT_1859017 [Mycena galopus ATCC 62051]|nr:hypothetical protein K438DRAFT_1859017 [Mycena galopus ATCC 62051]